MSVGGMNVDLSSLDNVNFNRWNRRILNVYWIIVALSVVVAILQLKFTHWDPQYYITRYIVLPTVILVTFMLITEAIYYRFKRSTTILPYCVISSGTGIATVLITLHPTVDPIGGALILPLLTSCIYYRKKLIIYAMVNSFGSLTLLLTFNQQLKDEYSIVDTITMFSILTAGAILAIATMSRGFEFLRHLQNTMKSSQDLMTEKIIMEKLAKTDALTGLNNHLTFHKYLDDLLEHSQNFSIQMALLDIDNFKRINDTFGHQAGDTILKYTSEKIKEMITPDDFIARYGGEEFAIIFVEKSMEESYQILERIRKEMHSTLHRVINNQCITVSVGLHEYLIGDEKNELFEGADQALYTAKHTGKNKTIIFSNQNKEGFQYTAQ
jgi:diguanylate cyclase (GGDEF)-like protein